MTSPSVAVIGAGVIGQVHAALLHAAGHRVTLIARGPLLEELRRDGVRVTTPDRHFRSGRSSVPVAARDELETAEIVLVAVGIRAMPAALAEAASLQPRIIIPFGHHDGPLPADAKTVRAFPGIGGGRLPDGTVEWLPVAEQPTTVDLQAPQAGQVLELLASTGLRVTGEPRMQDWLDTHSIFIAMLAAAIVHADYDAVAAGSDPALMRRLAAATRAGLRGYRRRGGRVRTRAIDLMYRQLPTGITARYTGGLLSGPTGTRTIEPHCRASRDSELPLIFARARELCGPEPLVTDFLTLG